jgi:hypothetical protein
MRVAANSECRAKSLSNGKFARWRLKDSSSPSRSSRTPTADPAVPKANPAPYRTVPIGSQPDLRFSSTAWHVLSEALWPLQRAGLPASRQLHGRKHLRGTVPLWIRVFRGLTFRHRTPCLACELFDRGRKPLRKGELPETQRIQELSEPRLMTHVYCCLP